jgi:hypothetical protein
MTPEDSFWIYDDDGSWENIGHRDVDHKILTMVSFEFVHSSYEIDYIIGTT